MFPSGYSIINSYNGVRSYRLLSVYYDVCDDERDIVSMSRRYSEPLVSYRRGKRSKGRKVERSKDRDNADAPVYHQADGKPQRPTSPNIRPIGDRHTSGYEFLHEFARSGFREELY